MNNTSPPSAPALPQDLADFVADTLTNPDGRLVACFLFGWVFWYSLCALSRAAFHSIFRAPRGLLRQRGGDVEAALHEKPQSHADPANGKTSPQSRDTALLFALNLSFAFASVASFISLLNFNPRNGNTDCAFTVAWASMSFQAGRWIGIFAVVMELRRRGARLFELSWLFGGLLVTLGSIFAHISTNTGTVVTLPRVGLSVCFQRLTLSTTLLSMMFFILLELCVAGRVVMWNARSEGKLLDLHFARAFSLLCLDLMVAAPSSMTGNLLARGVTFSVGASIVLVVFNIRIPGNGVTLSSSEPSPIVSSLGLPDPYSRLSVPPPDFRRSASDLPSPPRSPVVFEKEKLVQQGFHGDARVPQFVQVVTLELPPEPQTAPPYVGEKPAFTDMQSRRILPFQVQYAEQLEKEAQTGPRVPPRPQRPSVRVMVDNLANLSRTATLRSIALGSDIIRITPASAFGGKPWSPSSSGTSSAHPGRESSEASPSGIRDSRISNWTMRSSSSTGSRSRPPYLPSRQVSRKKRSPKEGLLRAPFHNGLSSRFSASSSRTFGAREELAPVREGSSVNESVGSSGRRSLQADHPPVSRSRSSHILRNKRSPTSPLSANVQNRLMIKVEPRVREYTVTQASDPTPPSASSANDGHSPIFSPPVERIPRTASLTASYARVQGSGRLIGPRVPSAALSPPLSAVMPSMGQGAAVLATRERPS